MNDLTQFTSLEYLQDYDIHVRRYLTLAQIQKIVNAVKIFDMWSERQQNIDLLTLVYATDITPEQIEELGHDILLESGLIDAVKAKIINFGDVQKAIDYTESVQRGVSQIVKELPNLVKSLSPIANRVIKDGLASKKS